MFNFNLDGTAKKVVMGALAGVAVAAIGLIVVYKDKKDEQEIQNKIDGEIADRCAEIDIQAIDGKMTVDEASDAKRRASEEVKFKYDKKLQRQLKLLNVVTKIGLWAEENKKVCAGLAALFGTATTVVGFVNGIRSFGMKNKIESRLANIEKICDDRQWVYRKGYNDSFHKTVSCIKAALTDPQYEGIFEMRSADDISLIKVKVAEAA